MEKVNYSGSTDKTLQIANNNQVEDFRISGGQVLQDFSGKWLELKYVLRDERSVDQFLENKSSLQNEVRKLRKDLKFGKIFCRFDFGAFLPSVSLQQKLVAFQREHFDEVTVQLINRKFDDFKIVFKYAKGQHNAKVSSLVDLSLSPPLLLQVLQYLVEEKPSSTRWYQRKFSTYIHQYRLVNKVMQKADIDYLLVSCRKRCSIDEASRNVDISTVAKSFFGFKGCCHDYRPANKAGKKGQRRFAMHMDVFNPKTYEWEMHVNDNYKVNRLRNYLHLDAVQTSEQEAKKREKVKHLLVYLQALPN
ncbi:MAG: hypothetical protein KKG59_00315 [Nanoarchaeota archaeon]|nr:hypothetical protein [Nanoarchaeota archaeon]